MVGAGIAGVCCAIELLRDGYRVTLIDSGPPGGEQAASFGNGAWLSPSSVVPLSMPGLWRRVPGFLRDPLGPLVIRPGHLPRLAPWLLRFVRAGSSIAKVERTSRALRCLVWDAPERHRQLADEANVPKLIQRRGLLYIYPDRAAFEREALAWRLRRDNGVRWLELDADELRQREPALQGQYGFGALVEEGAHCTNPGRYVAALAAHAEARGAAMLRRRVTGLEIGGRVRAVLTPDGPVPCDAAVIAAGAHSRMLARAAGDRVPLESERGYHAMIHDPNTGPRHPVMPSDGKMSVTWLDGGLRVAGQVELASLTAPPDWRRAHILRDWAVRAFPGLELGRVTYWMGHRPSIADGLPVLGPGSSPCLFYAFGHGHIGLASGPATGRLVANLVSGHTPAFDLTPFSARRFA